MECYLLKAHCREVLLQAGEDPRGLSAKAKLSTCTNGIGFSAGVLIGYRDADMGKYDKHTSKQFNGLVYKKSTCFNSRYQAFKAASSEAGGKGGMAARVMGRVGKLKEAC